MIKQLNRLLAALCFALFAAPAFAQWQVPNHAIPVGTGAGQGFHYAASGTAGQLLIDQGASANPAFEPVTGNCGITSAGVLTCTTAGLTVGTSTIAGGTTARPLYDNAGVLGEYAQVPLAQGGTNANLAASNGGLFYSTASAAAILSGTATAGQIPRSGANSAPAWSTTTYPATNPAGTVLGALTANTLTATAAPVLGINASAAGALGLADGGASGATVTVQNPAATTAYNFNLPATVGSSGQLMQSAAGGSSPMTWWAPAAHAVILGNGAAAPGAATIGTGGRLLIDQGAGVDPAFEVASGDCTVAATGAHTCTKTSGVAFAASATTDTTQAGNISGGTLPSARMPALTGDVTSSSGSIATTISSAAVSNSKLANSGAATLKGNPTASSGAPTDFTIQGLTARGTPDATNDKLVIYDNAAGTLKYVTPSSLAGVSTPPSGSSGQIQYNNAGSFGGLAQVDVPRGGTGLGSFTANLPLIGNGTGALAQGTLSGNTTQFITGTTPETAGTCLSFDASGNVKTVAAACQTGGYTAANTSPASQTIQAQLTKQPVTCEDIAACGTSDDTATVISAMQYAQTTNRCFSFHGNIYTVTNVVLSGFAGGCILGPGGLSAKSSATSNAVLEIKDSTGVYIDNDVTLSCNAQTGVTNGFKLWQTSGGASASEFNHISFHAIAYCKNAIQFGDTTNLDANAFSENTLQVDYTYQDAKDLLVIGAQAVVNVIRSNLIADNTSFSGVTPDVVTAVCGAVEFTGGEAISETSSGSAAVVQPCASPTYGHVYGYVEYNGTEIEVARLATISNPSSVSSPQGGAFTCIQCHGFVGGDVAAYVAAASDFIGTISTTANRFFATSARTNINISAPGATVYFDQQSFGADMTLDYAGVSAASVYMVSKDLPPSRTVTTSVANAGESMVTFACSATCTYTLPPASGYIGRSMYFTNATAQIVNSASSNILNTSGSAVSAIFPATTGKWIELVSDPTSGNFWRVVANN